MIPFRAHALYKALMQFERDEHYIGTVGSPPAQQRLNAMFCKREITELKNFSSQLELVETHGRVKRFEKALDFSIGGHKNFTVEEFSSEIAGIREAFEKELAEREFVFIPRGKSGFFERDDLFGETFHKSASPEINAEIKSTGNCLAADLNTAAVFHLMRVVEFGLRALARHLRVKTVKKHVPVAFGTWEEIIKALTDKTDALSKLTRGTKRQDALDFYNGLLVELRAIKDFWRNKVMHAHDSYDEHQAISAFTHVRRFMQTLETRVAKFAQG